MKVVRLNNEELNEAISHGPAYIEVGKRNYMLFEVDEVDHTGYYDVWIRGKRNYCSMHLKTEIQH